MRSSSSASPISIADGKLKDGVRVEPLILRAAAGDWIKVTLINGFGTATNVKPFDQSIFVQVRQSVQ